MVSSSNETKFFFVEGFQADAQAKKGMKRHIMMGKNAGKTLQRRSRLQDRFPHAQQYNDTSSESRGNEIVKMSIPAATDHNSVRELLRARSLPSTLRNMRPLGIPQYMSPQAYAIVTQFFDQAAERLYPVHLGIASDAIKVEWLRILLSDSSAFECILAMFQASIQVLVNGGRSSDKALYHTGRTLELLQQKLEEKDALSDSTIGAVLSLITHEQVQQQYTAAAVHMRGLVRLIELRGGLQELRDSRTLLGKVFVTDINYAVQLGSATSFPVAKVLPLMQGSSSKEIVARRHEFQPPEEIDALDPHLRGIWVDTMTASSILNRLADAGTLNLSTYHEITIPLAYRLLEFRTLDTARRFLDQDSAHHMALVAFVMTLFMQHTHRCILRLDLAAEGLDVIFGTVLNDDYDDAFVLWFAILADMWLGPGQDEERLFRIIRERSSRLCLSNWADAERAMRKSPWIDKTHGTPGRRIWDAAHDTI